MWTGVKIALGSGALALGFFACSSNGNPSSTTRACVTNYDLIYTASDYTSSLVGGCDLDGGNESPFHGPDLGSDPALATSGGRAFFIARSVNALGSAIFEIDPHCGAPFAKYGTDEKSYAGTANPQDVAVTSAGALWIPRFNVPSLLILDAKGNRAGSVDLSAHDPDGNPNMTAIRIRQIGGAEKAFVALERLDDHAQFASKLPSSIVRIDVASLTVEAEATLAGRDPFGAIVEANGGYFLAAPGNFDVADEKDAGIERFDPATFTTTYLLGEAALGASATEVAVSGSCGVAIVADPTHAVNATSLVTFDADHGEALTTAKNPVLATSGFDLAGLTWHGDVLLVGDRRAVGGKYPVHAFDRTGACDLTERPDAILLTQKPTALRSTAP